MLLQCKTKLERQRATYSKPEGAARLGSQLKHQQHLRFQRGLKPDVL
jgi:hypothetical protein